MNSFKISLAAARVNAKLTQNEVAKQMSMSKQTIVNWEKGKVVPKPAEFEMMCRIYNIPPDCVFLNKT